MSNPGTPTPTVDTTAAPLVPVPAPTSTSPSASAPEDGGVAVTSDTITDELLSDDILDIDEVVDSNTDDDDEGEKAPKAPLPAPVPAAAPAPVAPVPAPVAPAATPAAPVAPVAAAPAATVVDPPQPQPAAQQTMEEVRASLRENYTRARNEMETALATAHYKLPDEVVTALNEGDTTKLVPLIPKLAAQIHMDAMTSAVAHVMQYMPNMLSNLMEAREVETKAQETFFQAWPQLNMNEHGSVIQRLGVAYRQANPSASAADFIRDVGAQVVVALKLAVQAPTNGAAPAAAVKAPAFRPAGAGGGGSAPAPTAVLNPFEALALSEDEGEVD